MGAGSLKVESFSVLKCRKVCLEAGEIFGNFLLVPIDGTDELSLNDAATIDDVGFRKFEGTVARCDGSIYALVSSGAGIANGEQVDAMVFEKFVIGVGIIVHTHGENGNIGVLEFLLHLDERGHFFDARRAPGGPEVQNDDLAAKLVKGNRMLAILDGESGGRLADAGRLGTVIAG